MFKHLKALYQWFYRKAYESRARFFAIQYNRRRGKISTSQMWLYGQYLTTHVLLHAEPRYCYVTRKMYRPVFFNPSWKK